MALIGRDKEKERLRRCLESDHSEFVIVYGRRRIGKTFLIKEFFKNKFTFYFVGVHNQGKDLQLGNFAYQLQKTAKSPFAPKLESWNDAFRELQNYIETLDGKHKKVIFFDEMPWMDTQKSGFVSALETFWNSWATFRDDILFVACGSATSWIVNKILRNQGGLHGRTTAEIYLRPFNLKETEELLQKSGIQWDRYQIAQAYMTLGGVPYYYTLLDKGMSLAQNIDLLFFSSKNATLRVEFKELFASLFKNSDKYLSVIKTLAERREGYTRTEISAQTSISGTGLTDILDNLERCDFIFGYAKFNGGSKNTIYRISDFYTLFYYSFVDGNATKDQNYWQNMIKDGAITAWQGFSFELLCFLHLQQIKNALGIAGVSTKSTTWRSKNRSAQIDLVIERADRIINLCEIKFSQNEYQITPDYANTIRHRAAIFTAETGTKYGISNTFITTYGILNGKGLSVVNNEIVLDDLFKE